MSSFFDTHVHLDDPRYDEDRQDVIGRMRQAGVQGAVCVGADMPTSRAALALCGRHADLFCAAGVHPHEAKAYVPQDDAELAAMLAEPKCVALGEIGLDFHYDLSPRDVQRAVFARQLQLAADLHARVIFHVREAHGEAYDIIRACPVPGVMHCYSGSREMAARYLDLGLYISFAGPLTFKNARGLAEVAAYVPLDRALVETDGPYLAPDPMRGKRNEPAYVAYTARRFAQLRSEPEQEVLDALVRNARTFFQLT